MGGKVVAAVAISCQLLYEIWARPPAGVVVQWPTAKEIYRIEACKWDSGATELKITGQLCYDVANNGMECLNAPTEIWKGVFCGGPSTNHPDR